MANDPTSFHLHNIADTCSIWNMLSSERFYAAAHLAGCAFCCTFFVEYECLHKPRRNLTAKDVDLRNRLAQARSKSDFATIHLDIEDMQDVDVLGQRKNLSKGELSTIVLAKKTRQAFLSDDKNASKLAQTTLDHQMVQTTPHLLSWLFFHRHLLDSDKNDIVAEHLSYSRGMHQQYEESYREAMRCRLMVSSQPSPAAPASS